MNEDYNSLAEESVPLLLPGHVGREEALSRKRGTYLVLFSQMLERIAYYSLYGNLLLYLNKDPLCWDSASAVSAVLVFSGCSYFFGVFGGWLGDAVTGKFGGAVLGYVVYMISYCYFPLVSGYTDLYSNSSMYDADPDVVDCHGRNTTIANTFFCTNDLDATQPCAVSLYLSLVFLGFGHSVVQTNLAPFGSDQVKHLGSESLQSFFLKYYWFINIGAILANLPVSYLMQEYNFFWGYILALSCIVLSAFTFIIGYPLYLKRPLTGSPLKTFFEIHGEALKVWRIRSKVDRTSGLLERSDNHEAGPRGLEYALIRFGGSYHDAAVQDCRSLYKVVIVFLMLLPYWICYMQMSSSYMLQILHLRLPSSGGNTLVRNESGKFVPASNFVLPANSLTLFNNMFLILGLPVMNNLVYPWCNRTGRQMTLLLRMSLGMGLSFLSVLAAAIVEHVRVSTLHDSPEVYQIIGNSVYIAADMSVFAVVPQYALVGLSEIFLTVPGMEYAYIQAPPAMQGLVMGLFWATAGLGSFIGAALPPVSVGLNLFSSGQSESINDKDSHLEYYLYILAFIQLVGLAVFVVVSKKCSLGLDRVPSPKSRSLRNSTYVSSSSQ